jgi:L-iditol 2-dehydrogenase
VKSLVKIAKGEGLVELRDIPKPGLPDDHVMIEVKAAGVCGTDLHIFHDQFPYYPPVVLGHEFSGEIVEVGGKVRGWQVSERVVAEPHTLACGMCGYCRMGNLHLCPHRRSIGWGIDGAFARYLPMPAHLLHRIPDGVGFDEAALTEPLAVAVRAVMMNSRVEPGDVVVVQGAGPIGLLAAMAARASGASRVVVFGVGEDARVRLPVARQVGVDHAINLSEMPDPVQFVEELTDGRGADLVVEAAGATSAVVNSIRMVRRQGRIAAVGLTGSPSIEIPWDAAVIQACEIKFTFSTTYDSWARSLSLMSSRTIDVRPLITRQVPLEDWRTAFEMLESKEGIKCLLVP